MDIKKVLVTGGAGFIGSHTAVELLNTGFELVVIDNFSNSEPWIIKQIESITQKKISFYQADVTNQLSIQDIFNKEKPDVVIHFAAYKSVGESVTKPLMYFQNNIDSLMVILSCMSQSNCKKLVFSSSCTIYGNNHPNPLIEDYAFSDLPHAYGSSKQICETILQKTTIANQFNIISLRYFNPIGAHPSGLLGELPKGTPNNIMPYITQVAIGKLPFLTIFGNDYPTPDGTCIRDYIHISDLAEAHVFSCKRLLTSNIAPPYEVFNLGTGTGVSVLELINHFETENNVKIPYKIGLRRPGDAVCTYANPEKSKKNLKWEAKRSIKEMVKDGWRWQLFIK
ncbi:MAG: UDP-glucose 4-epimerase GalE [Phycisphaerales bacterium]|nr:UDP-glucose 4-epimerase GalE [Phycisphaerales bacterium]